MQFDTFVVARLLEGPNPPVLTEDGENEPAGRPPGAHRRPVGVRGPDRRRPGDGPGRAARREHLRVLARPGTGLGDRDPAVVAGKYVHEYAVWRAPRSMIVPGSGIPPRSIAEVIRRAD